MPSGEAAQAAETSVGSSRSVRGIAPQYLLVRNLAIDLDQWPGRGFPPFKKTAKR
jgi:hypothetical protein